MKKKLLFSSYNLDIGGIETSLINMILSLDYDKYDVTLLLERKEGIFLNKLPASVKVFEYNTSNDKNILVRKIKNGIKLYKYIHKFKNKFDFAGLYAPYLGPEVRIIKKASKNNVVWIHSNYYYVYNKDINKMKKFFDDRKIAEFNKIIFVSNESKNDFLNVYPSLKNKSYVLSNIIDYNKIVSLSSDNAEKYNVPLIVFVGRLDEESKRISLLINSLSKFNNDYECLIIGDGPDKEKYQSMIEELSISNKIKLLGKKENPYPYIKNSDLVILTSNYEGFPVVLMEAIILNKLFISTVGVSDKYINLDNYGYVINSEDLVNTLDLFFNRKLKIKKIFNYEKYIKNIKEDLEKVINNEEI